MFKLIFIPIIVALTIAMSFAKDNPYIQQYGYSEIIPSTDIYSQSMTNPLSLDDLAEISRSTVLVTSTKDLKLKAAQAILERLGLQGLRYKGISVESGIAEQPIGLKAGKLGASNRIENALKLAKPTEPTTLISIESYFETEFEVNNPTDFALVIIQTPDGVQHTYISNGVEIPETVFNLATQNDPIQKTGYLNTIGAYLAQTYGLDPSDWQPQVTKTHLTREQQILSAVSHSH